MMGKFHANLLWKRETWADGRYDWSFGCEIAFLNKSKVHTKFSARLQIKQNLLQEKNPQKLFSQHYCWPSLRPICHPTILLPWTLHQSKHLRAASGGNQAAKLVLVTVRVLCNTSWHRYKTFLFFPQQIITTLLCSEFVSVWVVEMLYHFCVSFREHHFFPLRPSRLLQCHLVKQHFPLAAFSLVFFSVRFSLHSQRRSCFATFLTARANKRSTWKWTKKLTLQKLLGSSASKKAKQAVS